ncbi:MAG: hypothetical protein ACTSRS_07055 [Candidatus Helarchaeota archaeon]
MTLMQSLRQLILKRGITLQEDPILYKNTLKRSFLAAFFYSIVYGIYENTIVYHGPRFVELMGSSEIGWGLMYSGLLLTVAIAPRFPWYKILFTTLIYAGLYILAGLYFQPLILPIVIGGIILAFIYLVSFEQVVMGLFFMAVFEDLVYFMTEWVRLGVYPYPAGNWWDSTIASYAALGGLGWPLPFWPYVPFYYLPGFAMIILFYVASYIGPKPSRIVSWILGPFFLAIIAGALGTVDTARIILIVLPLVSYVYVTSIYLLRNKIT